MAIRDWYARHVPEDQLLHYLVSYLNERLPRPLWARLPIASSVYSSIAQGRIEARLVEFGGAAVRVVSASDIVSVALHDLENRVGLRVVSDVDIDGRRVKGGFPWLALGDGQLHKSSAGSVTKRMATAAVITSLRDLERIRGVGRKLAGKRLSASQQAEAVRQALGGMVSAALAFVPREDPTVRKDGANTPLPGQTPGKSPLDWRWGQLGDVTYHVVDEAIKNRIANEVASHLSTVDNSDQRRVLAEFVKHLRADGIRAIERAVGKKAR
jgi:hypothetical protein